MVIIKTIKTKQKQTYFPIFNCHIQICRIYFEVSTFEPYLLAYMFSSVCLGKYLHHFYLGMYHYHFNIISLSIYQTPRFWTLSAMCWSVPVRVRDCWALGRRPHARTALAPCAGLFGGQGQSTWMPRMCQVGGLIRDVLVFCLLWLPM